jgi:hypothetical protein
LAQKSRNKPLGLLENESTSLVNPNPEPLPKPPPPPLEMLISFKLLSILPEPIEDIKPPLLPLFFSIYKKKKKMRNINSAVYRT